MQAQKASNEFLLFLLDVEPELNAGRCRLDPIMLEDVFRSHRPSIESFTSVFNADSETLNVTIESLANSAFKLDQFGETTTTTTSFTTDTLVTTVTTTSTALSMHYLRHSRRRARILRQTSTVFTRPSRTTGRRRESTTASMPIS